MAMALLGILVAALSGVLMSVQGVFNTEVTKQGGIWMSAAFVQFTAFATCVLAWIISGRNGSLSAILSIDRKYLLLGGVIGAFITYTVIKSISLAGPAKATLVIVTAQLLAAYIIELFGLFGVEKAAFEIKKLIGIILAAVGFVIFNF
jgi:transporter family-2 protein